MTIKKYLHSCILLQENGKKLLIDPGAFSFIEKKISVSDIGAVDAIIYTHVHPDHYYPEALREFLTLNPETYIGAHGEISVDLTNQGIAHSALESNQVYDIAEFTVKTVSAPHGIVPRGPVSNLGFLVNNIFYSPGDSLVPPNEPVKVLGLPMDGPWLLLTEAVTMALAIRPDTVIPIHDNLTKEFMTERLHDMVREKIEPAGIAFNALTPSDDLIV